MDPLSILKSIIKFEQPKQPEPLNLKQGQIINGKIVQLLSNRMAIIQIGSQKLMAKLEASLNLNQQYWFKVQSEGGKIHLKLVNEKTLIEPSESFSTQNSVPDRGIEQIFTQVPVQFGQEHAELLIQWNGRKKENGKIDSENCRILFYVELKNIGEIFVDLQFQNRKVKIVMLNDTHDLMRMAQSQISLLQNNLMELNFQLSSLIIEPPPTEKSMRSLIRKTTANEPVEPYQGRGVDVRI